MTSGAGRWATSIILLDCIPLLKVQRCTKVTAGFARLIFWIVLRSLMDLISLLKKKKKKKRDFCNANMSHISGSWSILIVCDLAHILQWKKGKQINKKEQQLPELLRTIKNNAWKVDVEMRINEFLSSGSKKRKTKTTKEIEKAHRTHIYQNYRLIAWPELARG